MRFFHFINFMAVKLGATYQSNCQQIMETLLLFFYHQQSTMRYTKFLNWVVNLFDSLHRNQLLKLQAQNFNLGDGFLLLHQNPHYLGYQEHLIIKYVFDFMFQDLSQNSFAHLFILSLQGQKIMQQHNYGCCCQFGSHFMPNYSITQQFDDQQPQLRF